MDSPDLFPPTRSDPPASFEWGQVMRETGMRGLAAMLARYIQLVEYDPVRPFLEIEIYDQMAPIAQSGALDSLTDHLKQFFGPALQLSVGYGAANDCLAMKAQEKRVGDMETTMKALMDDPFLAEMSNAFGAKVYVDSIAQAPAEPPAA